MVKPGFVTDATNESYHPDSSRSKTEAHWTNPRLAIRDETPVGPHGGRRRSPGRIFVRPAHPERDKREPVPDFEDVLYEVADGRATITINRPDRLNAFRRQTIRELAEAFEAAADDEAVGVIVFTGAGERAFCVGGDVRDPTRTAAEKRSLHHLHDRLALGIRNNGKPIIVKVRGYCIGGGNELNVLCDLTISGASGKFGQAGPKIGSAPLWWGCQLLPHTVGEKKAREILYLTRQYSAEEALAMGLVNAVVPDEELDAEVDRWCDQILRRSPQGLRLAKIAMNTATDALYSAVQHGLELVALNHVYGEEPKEGIASFQEKRPADWRKFRDGQGPEPG